MSTRPRFADDGRLRLPAEVQLDTRDEPAIAGTIGSTTIDPFERMDSDLLLVEEFARLDLSPRASLPGWFARHGAVLGSMSQAMDEERLAPRRFPLHPSDPLLGRDPNGFVDLLRTVASEQRSVGWHLGSLARLSDHLQAGGPWDPAWAAPVLDIRQYHATIAGPDGPAADPAWLADEDDEYRERRTERRERTRRRLLDGLGDDPGSLMEFQRRLMAPYLSGVGSGPVRVGWANADADPTDMGARGPLALSEQRVWTSLLIPVYIQLFEGLRRVSEGLRGGVFCRECGLPFLVLDARRAAFCNDRERFRNGQRLRRDRLGLPAGKRKVTQS